MSASVGRRILRHFCGNYLKKLSTHMKIVRFISITNHNLEVCTKTKVPTAGNISAALLKEFCNPLIIETIKPPKISQANEVSMEIIKLFS